MTRVKNWPGGNWFGGAFSTLKIEKKKAKKFIRGHFQQLENSFFLSQMTNTRWKMMLLKIDPGYKVLNCLWTETRDLNWNFQTLYRRCVKGYWIFIKHQIYQFHYRNFQLKTQQEEIIPTLTHVYVIIFLKQQELNFDMQVLLIYCNLPL